MATGLRITPFDKGDPRLDKDLWDCFARTRLQGNPAAEKIRQEIEDLEIQGVSADDPVMKVKNEELKKLTDARADLCREQAKAKNWNASAWSLGVAPTWISSTGQTSDLKWNSASVWSSLSYGFDGIPGLAESSQLLGGVRYNNREMVPDPKNSGAFVKQDTFTAGLQVRLSVHRPDPKAAPTFIMGGEGDYVYADPDGRPITNSYRVSFAGELKVPGLDSTYLKVTVGGEGGGSPGHKQGFVLTSLNFGLL